MPDASPVHESPGNADEQSASPPSRLKEAIVQCRDFRCLAYLDAQGNWRNHRDHQLLPEVLQVVSVLSELGPQAGLKEPGLG